MEESHPEERDDEINLLDYLIVLLKHKKLIIGVTLTAAVVTAIISLILTPIYKAETRILPPAQSTSSIGLALLSQAGGLADIAGGALGVKTPADLYVGMLEGTTVADRIIDRFDVMKLHDIEYRVDARKLLAEKILDAKSDKKSGIITVAVEDEDPKRAAEMANAFVEELKVLTKGLAVSEAAQRRLFFEEELKDTKQALAKAEESMRGFQEKTGALKMEDQAKAVIEGIATMRAQIAAKEVEVKVMRTYATSNNPDLQKAEEVLKGLRAELQKLESKGGANADPLMPTGRMPEVGLEYLRKLRDLKFNETLYELLTKQYELARLDEARDAAVIQVIDRAVPPDKKAKPKRGLMVAIATVAGFFLSVFAAFLWEYIETASSDPENKERFSIIKKHLYWRKRSKLE